MECGCAVCASASLLVPCLASKCSGLRTVRDFVAFCRRERKKGKTQSAIINKGSQISTLLLVLEVNWIAFFFDAGSIDFISAKRRERGSCTLCRM